MATMVTAKGQVTIPKAVRDLLGLKPGNSVAFAELSVRFAIIESLDAFLRESAVALVTTPRSALFLAGKVFQRYRAAGGQRSGVSPDFVIGAHAAVMGVRLLRRDPKDDRTYFPKIDLVTPDCAEFDVRHPSPASTSRTSNSKSTVESNIC